MVTIQQSSIHQSKPKPFLLPAGRVAFVIIDMQRDFVQNGGYGSYQCPSKEIFENVSSTIQPIKRALEASRAAGVTVIHTREGHNPSLNDCAASKLLRQKDANPERHAFGIGDKGPMGRLLVQGEYGHDIIDDLKPLQSEIVLDKPAKGSFCNTNFYQILTASGITHIILAGVTTECCVSTTFREANDRGFECCVLSDCTGGFNDDIVKWSLEGFSAYDGLFGYVSNSADYINSLHLYQRDDSDYVHSRELSLDSAETESKEEEIKKIYNATLKVASILDMKIYPWEHIAKRISDLERYHGDLPPLYGIPFLTTSDIPIEYENSKILNLSPLYADSKLFKQVISLGAIHIGTLPESNFFTGSNKKLEEVFNHNICSFVLSLDIEGGSDFSAAQYHNQRVFSFTPSSELFRTKLLSEKVSIFTKEISLARHLWKHLIKFDKSSSITPPIDFRDIPDRNLKIGFLIDSEQYIPSGLQEMYREYVEFVKSITNCTLVPISWSEFLDFETVSELIRGQQKVGILQSTDIKGKYTEYLEQREYPGWEVGLKMLEFNSKKDALIERFDENGINLLMIPTMMSENITEYRVNCFNSLQLPSITASKLYKDLSITLTSRSELDYRILDFVQFLIKNI